MGSTNARNRQKCAGDCAALKSETPDYSRGFMGCFESCAAELQTVQSCKVSKPPEIMGIGTFVFESVPAVSAANEPDPRCCLQRAFCLGQFIAVRRFSISSAGCRLAACFKRGLRCLVDLGHGPHRGRMLSNSSRCRTTPTAQRSGLVGVETGNDFNFRLWTRHQKNGSNRCRRNLRPYASC